MSLYGQQKNHKKSWKSYWNFFWQFLTLITLLKYLFIPIENHTAKIKPGKWGILLAEEKPKEGGKIIFPGRFIAHVEGRVDVFPNDITTPQGGHYFPKAQMISSSTLSFSQTVTRNLSHLFSTISEENLKQDGSLVIVLQYCNKLDFHR